MENSSAKGVFDLLKEADTISEKIKTLVYSAKVKDWATFVTALSALVVLIGGAFGLQIGSDVVNTVLQFFLSVIAVISLVKNKTA